MKKPFGTRLLAACLSVVMLTAMVPPAWAAEDTSLGNDAVQAPLTPQPESPLADGDGTDDTPEAPIVLRSVSLDQQSMSLKVGERGTLTAKLTTTDGTVIDYIPQGTTVHWESNAPDEVKVLTSDGSLTIQVEALKTAETNDPIKEVSITVTVTPSGQAPLPIATCNVTVSPNTPPGITVTPQTLELAPGQSGQLLAAVTPETAPQEVTWATRDASVATVTPGAPTTATVTGVSAGETEITASANGILTECVVQVQGIILDDSAVTLRVGKNYTLRYKIYGDSIKDSLTWTSSDPSVVEVSQGYLYPKNPGTATITVQINGYSNYTDSVEVTVEKATAEVIHASAGAASPLSFSSLVSRLQSQSFNVLQKGLLYVSGLSVSTQQGTLYYHYTSEGDTGSGVGTNETFYVSPGNGQNSLSDITFVPKPDFEGTAVISYMGYASGTEFFQGTIEVTVDAPQDVTYSTSNGNVIQFSASDFAVACRNRTGNDLSYVMFTLPDKGWGTLYSNYLSSSYPGTPVASTEKYKYSGSPNLGDVYFLPAEGVSDTIIIPYTAWNVNGYSYRGRVTIEVRSASASGDITYTVSQGGRVRFDDDDFNNLSRSLTGYNLDRVRFVLPLSSQGTLYYGYSSSGDYSSLVTESRDYYRSSSPYLDNITFVANKDYVGAVSIPFTAWDTRGTLFYGEVGITISSQGNGSIHYAIHQNGMVNLDDSDFNDLSRSLTGSNLYRVRFTLPASSQGTLYYDYTSSGNYDSKVNENLNYYRTSSPRLDDVTFVAASGFSGTVYIPFTGWNTEGESFSGTVEIDVGGVQSSLSYQITSGQVLTFQDGDFDDYCRSATGDSLNFVRFTLPSTSYGTLYYDYTSPSQYGSKVTASRSYYRSSSPYLDRVSFVPSGTYSGTFSLSFTGESTKGRQFSGTVTITVNQVQADVITYYTSYQPVALRSSDFESVCSQQRNGTLSSVQFTGVDQITGGHLYYRYNGIHSANSQVRSATSYYPSATPGISEISFVPLVGFQGTVSLRYTATTSNGSTYQGTVQIRVTPNTTSRYFSDMGSASWAAAAVDFLYENHVVTGTGTGTYSPQAPMTRGSFLVMLDQAFSFPSASGHTFSDVPSNAYYAQAVQKAYALGIASGYPDGTFRPMAPLTREAAATMLYQAMVSSGWSLSTESESVLYGYSDWQSISPYARNAMAVLVKNGLFSGDTQGRLRPLQTMTRAEMAVVLAKAVTL